MEDMFRFEKYFLVGMMILQPDRRCASGDQEVGA